jgi:2-polyprenyl-3-methyl-5-hydroxy-6-metoxy-1,4-benzoquinol methylase
MNTPKPFSIIQHPLYGYFTITPIPQQEEIAKFYEAEFYSRNYSAFNDSSLEVQREDLEFNEGAWSDIASSIRTILGRELGGLTVLDVGCGWCQCLMYLAKEGMLCYGFDPCKQAIEYGLSQGLNVREAGMGSMDVFAGKRFDVVMLNNVLEHLPDPVESLLQIRNDVISPTGVIIIDVPNDFNEFQKAGRDLHGLADWWVAPPGHLNYFSCDSLSALLAGVGYKVVLAESSFPLEMFLLFGECYVGDAELGKAIHKKRVNFETSLRRLGYHDVLRSFYQSLARLNLGRQIKVYAVPHKN